MNKSQIETAPNLSSSETVDEYRKKWGLKQSSFTQVPNLLLEYRDRLQIKDSEMFLLLVLLNHWWQHDRLPFPGIARLREMTGKTERSIQRNLKALVENETPVHNGWAKEPGYITINRRFGRRREEQGNGAVKEKTVQLSNEYSFDKLIRSLRALERDIAKNVAAAEAESRKRTPVTGK